MRAAVLLCAALALWPQGPVRVTPPSTPSDAAQQRRLPSGVWEAIRVNTGALPMTDRVVGTDGFTHAIRLHAMTIRLSANGRFQAALKYRRAILNRNEQIDRVPMQNDIWSGTFTVNGTKMRFVPERQGDRQVQPFDGSMNGRRISVGFDYEIVTRKHYVLEMERNDKVF
jgi:hypothetical protein